MVSLTEYCGSARICTGVPAAQAAQVTNCEDCKTFQDGLCRGRDPKIPVQVCCGVAILCLIFVTATVFS